MSKAATADLFTVDAQGTLHTDMYVLARHYGRAGLQRMVNDFAAAGVSQRAGMTMVKMVSAIAR